MSLYLIKLKCDNVVLVQWYYYVVAGSAIKALSKAYKACEHDSKDYPEAGDMCVQSLTLMATGSELIR